MKKLFLLSFVALALFTNACSKEDDENNIDPIEDNGMTEADLVGNWDFVSLEIDDSTYKTCDFLLKEKYNFTILSFWDVTLESDIYGSPSLIYFVDCGMNDNTVENELKFSIKDNHIIIGGIKYLIENADTFNDTELKLKVISTFSKSPNGGIFTLQKRK